ncbi:hypothetical protein ACI3KX_00450 [Microbacterium sp. ZW CA_36]|uniref:hypothetical protein n=1 Tax=Microbacterium sp. ZW CA_36 TaxID=3378078 RepID=UPI003853FBAF
MLVWAASLALVGLSLQLFGLLWVAIRTGALWQKRNPGCLCSRGGIGCCTD